jgi:hypothetical protein
MRRLNTFVALLLLLSSSFYSTAIASANETETSTLQEIAPQTRVLPAVTVNPLKSKKISVKRGRAVVFRVVDPEIWRGKVKNSAIAKFVPGGPQSTYETYPSLTILKKGKTSVSLTDGKKTYLLKLTVS